MDSNFNRSQQEDSGGVAMPVPLANFNPQQQNPIRVSAFSRPSADFGDNHHDLHLGTAPPTAPVGPTTPAAAGSAISSSSSVRYKECLRNHAASNGGHVLDGCCEFMPSGGDPFKCAACDCHRSFHRKHSDADSGSTSSYYRSRDRISVPLLLPPPHPSAVHHHHLHQKHFNSTNAFPPSPSGVVLGTSSMMAFGGNNSGSGATTESSSEEGLNAGVCEPLSSHEAALRAQMSSALSSKKRFRTKFTAEQKEKMMSLAEKLGWRFQRQDAAVVEQFCKETGIRRQVLKVWMHNNKHSMRKQQQEQLQHLMQHHQQSQQQQLPNPQQQQQLPNPQQQQQQTVPTGDQTVQLQTPTAAAIFGHART